MKKIKVFTILSLILNKKICTMDEFRSACNKAEQFIDVNGDGTISVKEAIYVILTFLKRKG